MATGPPPNYLLHVLYQPLLKVRLWLACGSAADSADQRGVADTAGAETGLAFRMLEAGSRLANGNPFLFAAPLPFAVTGIPHLSVPLLGFLSRLLLRHWHKSALGHVDK